MPAFYSCSVADFICSEDDELLAALHGGYARSGFTTLFSEQTLTWELDLVLLRRSLHDLQRSKLAASNWHLIFEFSIPRKEKRIDVVLLTNTKIVLLECKRSVADVEARKQVAEYALLLHYFHQPSSRRHLLPFVVSQGTDRHVLDRESHTDQQTELSFEALPTYWIKPTRAVTWDSLGSVLARIEEDASREPVVPADWLEGRYFPVPTIIEAARALRDGLKLPEIAHCEASELEIGSVSSAIETYIKTAERERKHLICFLTGVPGSGKTLVGLSLAHLGKKSDDAIHFLSGNGPLVMVLQENFRTQAMLDKVPSIEAKIYAKTLIENVHVFAKTYMEHDRERAPYHHVVIFDEAQRAWNRAQNMAKFKRPYSEPEMLLGLMERHLDWAVVIALVGGGQEINNGEAGLEEWGRAISGSKTDWHVVASEEVLNGGPSTAGRRLFPPDVRAKEVSTSPYLHLRTSNRSLRAETLAQWVNAVLDGDADCAAELGITEKFPIFLTRSLSSARKWLQKQSLGPSRYGLVGSSASARLRAEGLEPDSSFHAGYPWHHWYLAPSTDHRSSFQCEVFATEFEVQGLELDWVGVCWGGDFQWTGQAWIPRSVKTHNGMSRWRQVLNGEKQAYRKNAYRVLLTRARQGMIIFVPEGDVDDATRNPEELNLAANFLLRSGVRHL